MMANKDSVLPGTVLSHIEIEAKNCEKSRSCFCPVNLDYIFHHPRDMQSLELS